MEEEAEKPDYNKNKNFRSIKRHLQELNKPQSKYICEAQMSRKSIDPRTCKGLPQTIKGKQLQRRRRTEDTVGGPQRGPGSRAGQGLHTAATQDTGFCPRNVAF